MIFIKYLIKYYRCKFYFCSIKVLKSKNKLYISTNIKSQFKTKVQKIYFIGFFKIIQLNLCIYKMLNFCKLYLKEIRIKTTKRA